jgi:ATP-dependent RNA helicase DBP3
MGGKEKEVKVLAMKVAEEPLSDQISNKKKMKKKKREVEEKRFEQEEVSNDSSKKKKKEQSEEFAQEADTEVEEPVKKKKKKQMKEKKEREVDDNRSLKKNLSTGAEETAVVRGTAEAQLCVTVSGNGSADPKFAPLESFDLEGVPTSVLECCKTFAKPSPIQSHAWPFLLAGRDLVGIAATGSGSHSFVLCLSSLL